MTPPEEQSRFDSPQEARDFGAENGVRPYEEVADLWHAKTGERITRARCAQLVKRAEAKLRAIPGIENLLDGDPDAIPAEEYVGTPLNGVIDAMESVLYSGVGGDVCSITELQRLRSVASRLEKRLAKEAKDG